MSLLQLQQPSGSHTGKSYCIKGRREIREQEQRQGIASQYHGALHHPWAAFHWTPPYRKELKSFIMSGTVTLLLFVPEKKFLLFFTFSLDVQIHFVVSKIIYVFHLEQCLAHSRHSASHCSS